MRTIRSCRGFNSSMVRLGVLNSTEVLYPQLAFQFQHGAIGSDFPKICKRALDGFQFQHGAIGSRLESIVEQTTKKVSIPAWCDWECNSFTG